MLNDIPTLIYPEDNVNLCKYISEEEVWGVINQMNPDKVPGLDGFEPISIKNVGSIIKKYLLRMVQFVQSSAKIGGNTNSTFLSLIPKEINPTSFAIFSPFLFATYPIKSSPKS
jgi:hypothetical protein